MVASRAAALAGRRADYRVILIAATLASLALSRIPVSALVTQLAVGTRAVEPRVFFSPDAMAFCRQKGLEGPLFNSHNLGGYVAWMLYPQARIFQDSRLQAYPP